MTRGTPRNIDKDPGWVERRFRAVENDVADLSVGKLDQVPGSIISINQLLTDPAVSTAFRNVDSKTAATSGDLAITLTYIPIPGSEHVYWNTIAQEPTEWTRVGNVVTLLDPDDLIEPGDVVVVAYAYDGVRATIDGPPPTEDDLYPNEVIADSPLAYYRLGEASGTDMLDSSGNGHDGTYTTVTLGADGLISNNSDTAATFGASSKGEVTYGSWMGLYQFTFEAWIKPSSVSGNHVIASRHNDPEGSWLLRLEGTALKLLTWQGTGGTGAHTAVSSATFAAATRYHVVAVVNYYSGVGFIDFYINGVAAGSDTLASSVYVGNAPLRIGATYTGTENFAGVIDEVAYYSGQLSSDRIADHYAAGA